MTDVGASNAYPLVEPDALARGLKLTFSKAGQIFVDDVNFTEIAAALDPDYNPAFFERILAVSIGASKIGKTPAIYAGGLNSTDDPTLVAKAILLTSGEYVPSVELAMQHYYWEQAGAPGWNTELGDKANGVLYLVGLRLGLPSTFVSDPIGTINGLPPDHKAAVIDALTQYGQCFGPETQIDMWPLDDEFSHYPTNQPKIFDQKALKAKIWKKPIALIRKGDIVVSFDKNGNLVPGTVSRTFINESKVLLDYFGTMVTPGHVYYRPDSNKLDKFECLLDILRDDGVIQNAGGQNIRAATHVPVGDMRDGFVWAVIQEQRYGTLIEKERGRIRLGTRFITEGKSSRCVMDLIADMGGVVGEDELIHFFNAEPMPFVWKYGATLPKPEDFVLQASGTNLNEIYRANEWESRRPHLPNPEEVKGGISQGIASKPLTFKKRNQPLNLQYAADVSIDKRTKRSPMNRKQRKAMEAKLRKTRKVKVA